MDSFDGGRRRDGEPLEQRLDRWMSTGRQLVEGVSGGRPGARQASRRTEGRGNSRGGFDGLGRWVEDRLDWLLDDSDDWPEPWQEGARRTREATVERRLTPERLSPDTPSPTRSTRQETRAAAPLMRGSGMAPPPGETRARRPLEAVSRRPSATRSGATRSAALRNGAAPAPVPTPRAADAEDWPDDRAFSVPRWQRAGSPVRRPDPLRVEDEPRDPPSGSGGEAAGARPLPRSSRRR